MSDREKKHVSKKIVACLLDERSMSDRGKNHVR